MRRRSAFTLVELLAATALSLLLILTCLAVLRSIRRAEPAATDLGAEWPAAVAAEVRWDLANAVVVRQDAGGLLLGGYGSRDPATGRATHMPVVVTYRLREIAGKRWLVRGQSSLDPVRSEPATTDLVAADVGTLSVTMPGEVPRTSDDDPTPIVFRQLPGFRRVADGLRVRVTNSAAASIADEGVYGRGG